MIILDCTLRDGGYYNHWDFNDDIVDAYLDSMAKAKIDYVELGLRNFPQPQFLGPYAYTTENFLNSLSLPEGPTYGVMVDAKTILQSKLSIEDAINSLFVEKEKSKIGLVRIAAHFSEVNASCKIAKLIKEKGYLVGFNLMQSGGKPSELIENIAKEITQWNCVDVLYFADSLGNMDTVEVKRIVNALSAQWNGMLGIHTHNNMSKALDNAMKAYELGVDMIDVTVTGMGRGAGNAQTENLLAILNKSETKYNSAPVFDLVIRHFEKMQKDYGWGSNLLYFIGAQNNVHPTYIQNILSNERFGTDEIVGAIEYLSNNECSSYNGDVLEQALNLNSTSCDISGTRDLKNLFSGKDVLILGNGSSVEKYKNGIISYIKNKNPIVLSINVNKVIDQNLVDYYVATHNTKYLSEKKVYKDIVKPFILPCHRFTQEEMRLIDVKGKVIDYGLDVKPEQFQVSETFCVIPQELTVAYALAISVIANAKQIKLVGFDGYKKGDERQQEMVELLMHVQESLLYGKLESLTPTTYPIKKGSVYAPC